MGFLAVLGALLVVLTSILYIYLQWIWSYWKKQGVPQLEAKFPYGNFEDFVLTRKQIGFAFKDIYDSFKGERFVGTYMLTRTVIIFRDLELIRNCLIKDFKHFNNRGFYDESDREPLSVNLFVLNGQKWKSTRAKLSPGLTAAKMKEAVSIMSEAGAELAQCLEEPASNGEVIEIKDYVERYTTDIMFSFILGLECNSLSNPNTEYLQLSKTMVRPGFIRSLALFLISFFPSVSKLIPLTTMDPKISKCFRRIFWQSVNQHELRTINRDTFMQFLIQLKDNGEEEETFKSKDQSTRKNVSMNDLAAHAFFFLMAGLETTTSTVSFCLYELALNVDIQRQLQQEIDVISAKHSGQVTTEAINSMTYLDMVVSETLRKYSPVPILIREVTMPFLIPGTNVVLEKGTSVVIPVLAVHHDLQYYPDPEKFDPERFSEQEKSKRHKYSYIPFGEGPRICIGKRYGLLQVKLCLVSILSRYNVDVSEKTQIPLVIDPVPFIPSPVGGIWLKITKRKMFIHAD